MNPTIIACDIHDQIEIICMRQFPVILHLLNSHKVPGVAFDTASKAQQEFLLLDQDGQKFQVPFLEIEYIEVLADNAPQPVIWLR